MTSHLISNLGASILAVFLFVAGLILISGATLAGVLRLTGTGVVETTRALRRSTRGSAGNRGPPTGDRSRSGLHGPADSFYRGADVSPDPDTSALWSEPPT